MIYRRFCEERETNDEGSNANNGNDIVTLKRVVTRQ